ncbi:hypothetical protein [Ligilactobacillus agilis]|uniref:hypothetical protein n=1 Tax=Ligilactobacillus agilis TaxID=1601 RepID=UPI00195AFDAB|nr:hypothetical protein [Ligilactobacillus agilis]MBM6763279.1 hypothetical protein [Ligilactobacillus agilis]
MNKENVEKQAEKLFQLSLVDSNNYILSELTAISNSLFQNIKDDIGSNSLATFCRNVSNILTHSCKEENKFNQIVQIYLTALAIKYIVDTRKED